MFGTRKSKSQDQDKNGPADQAVAEEKDAASNADEPAHQIEEIGALSLGNDASPVSPPRKPFKKRVPYVQSSQFFVSA